MASGLKERSTGNVVQPIIWLIASLGGSVAATSFGKNPQIAYIVTALLLLAVFFFFYQYNYFAKSDPDRLQSESFQMKTRGQKIASKNKRVNIAGEESEEQGK